MDTQVFSGEKKVHLLWPDAARQRRLSWGSNGFLVKNSENEEKMRTIYPSKDSLFLFGQATARFASTQCTFLRFLPKK